MGMSIDHTLAHDKFRLFFVVVSFLFFFIINLLFINNALFDEHEKKSRNILQLIVWSC